MRCSQTQSVCHGAHDMHHFSLAFGDAFKDRCSIIVHGTPWTGCCRSHSCSPCSPPASCAQHRRPHTRETCAYAAPPTGTRTKRTIHNSFIAAPQKAPTLSKTPSFFNRGPFPSPSTLAHPR
ncbi:unnamed protein product [Ectocarpus sp. 8 AP-2014]